MSGLTDSDGDNSVSHESKGGLLKVWTRKHTYDQFEGDAITRYFAYGDLETTVPVISLRGITQTITGLMRRLHEIDRLLKWGLS